MVLQALSEDRHSPPLLTVNGPGELLRSKSADMEMTSEKEHIKKMLSEGYGGERGAHSSILSGCVGGGGGRVDVCGLNVYIL